MPPSTVIFCPVMKLLAGSHRNITVDGGMTKLMVYHNDYGWTYAPQETGSK